jgi:hypothetical protein
MSFNAPPGYGALKGLDVNSLCSTFDKETYQSEYDETYTLILKDKTSYLLGSVMFQSTCINQSAVQTNI